MTLRVYYLCAYYSQWAHENLAARSQPQWDAFKFCRAVKRRSISGYCTIPLKGGGYRIDAANIGDARRIFGNLVRTTMRLNDIAPDLVVPAPSKDSFDQSDFRSLEMAREALHWPAAPAVAGLVQFTTQLPPASEGGPRGYAAIRPHLAVFRDRRYSGSRVVLLDDILTTGGTLLATRDVLTEAGYEVDCAIVCGRTVSASEKSFEIRSFDLDDDPGEVDF